ncbi:diguanylate cyclase [Bacillus sp. FJAT-27445]|uniref:diguanylate cyclase n=1 Tax=Bacillus sp. FJAT-27445 TaxID=1679166 RepID=UPI0012E3A85F|nr:diguanylate cyclase [Bacillus sp. FJAT-27445]
MHLSINTAYHLSAEKKIRTALLPAIHISIVSLAVIAMFYFPFMSGGHRVDLRIIPIILLGFLHGWKYVLPVVAITSLYRLGLGGPTALHGALFGILLPAFFSLLANRKAKGFHSPWNLLGVLFASWAVSDLFSPKIRLAMPNEIAFMHLASLVVAFFVMYLFAIMGLRHLESNQKLQFHAERDPLTGLYNMRKFEEVLRKQIHPGKRMFIAMIDIDRFKEINDKFGHQVGDATISNVGKILLSNCGEDMVIARYGGDEFILFMASERILHVKQKLESIRKDTKEHANQAIPGTPPFTLSLSIGVAELFNASHLKETIEEADKQLYLAKKLGRDRVC